LEIIVLILINLANVIEKGATISSVTEFDGNFTISVNDADYRGL